MRILPCGRIMDGIYASVDPEACMASIPFDSSCCWRLQ
uniref:Uncharacterized protein n=1 Tax=Arundo donax TaxID=35708 RepID=A0A0A8ZS15_ARUDO